MILTININVDKLISEVGKDYYFIIENITASNIEWTNGGSGTVTDFEISVNNNSIETVTSFSLGFSASLVDNQNTQLYEDDNGVEVIVDHIITLTGTVNPDDNGDMLYMLQKGIITIKGVNNNNLIFAYRLDSERNTVNKSLYFIDLINGYFRNGIDIKNPTITIQDFDISNTFNYVYIYALNRYYYVQNIEVTTKNMTALALAEDVLMSHREVILKQTAFIERQENDYNLDLVDDLVITDYDRVISKETLTYSTAIFPANQTGETDREAFIVTVVQTV